MSFNVNSLVIFSFNCNIKFVSQLSKINIFVSRDYFFCLLIKNFGLIQW